MSGRKTYDLENIGKVVIGDNEHVATGGEGSVYYAGSDKTRVVKIYLEPQVQAQRGTFERLKLLTKVKGEGIAGPQGLVFLSGEPVGFWMNRVSGEGLALLTTEEGRRISNFGDKEAHMQLAGMRRIMQTAHDHRFLIPDPNQNNWLAELLRSGPKAHCLDVDGWSPMDRKQGGFVVAVGPAVMDYHALDASRVYNPSIQADWYGWGTVAVELLLGIHVYRGFIDGFPPHKYEPRARANASIFDKRCKLPTSVRDFKCINGPLRDWLYGEFQEGKRTIPPDPMDTGVAKMQTGVVYHAVTTSTGRLVFEPLYESTGDPVIRVFHCGVAVTAQGKLIDLKTKQKIGAVKSPTTCEVVKFQNFFIVVDWENPKQPNFSYINRAGQLPDHLAVTSEKVVRFENRLLLVTDQGLTEIQPTDFGQLVVLALGKTHECMVNSTRWYDGVGVMDMRGSKRLVAPHGTDKCPLVRIRELDGVNTVAAKAGHRFVAVMIEKNGEYHLLEFAFDETYSTYTVQDTEVDTPNLDVAILKKERAGKEFPVSAKIVKDDEIIIAFPTEPSVAINRIEDNKVTSRMALANWDQLVVYIENGSVWSVRMK